MLLKFKNGFENISNRKFPYRGKSPRSCWSLLLSIHAEGAAPWGNLKVSWCLLRHLGFEKILYLFWYIFAVISAIYFLSFLILEIQIDLDLQGWDVQNHIFFLLSPGASDRFSDLIKCLCCCRQVLGLHQQWVGKLLAHTWSKYLCDDGVGTFQHVASPLLGFATSSRLWAPLTSWPNPALCWW